MSWEWITGMRAVSTNGDAVILRVMVETRFDPAVWCGNGE